MTMGNERMGLQPLALTAEQRLTDRIDLLRSEVDRLRTLNNARGARLARIRMLLARWHLDDVDPDEDSSEDAYLEEKCAP